MDLQEANVYKALFHWVGYSYSISQIKIKGVLVTKYTLKGAKTI